MKYCKACLTTDLRPNSSFKDGVCIACEYSEQVKTQDSAFQVKLELLKQAIKRSRGKQANKQAYDCIVGVSGGKDSTRQAHWVRDRLGLRPLLVCCAYPPKQMTQVGADNLSNLISMGFDLITVTPAPTTSQQLALTSFKEFGNVCKSTEMSLFSTVPRIAIELGVNTIFWGENPALQMGDSAVEGFDEFDGNNLRNLNTLVDGGYKWLERAISEPYKSEHYFYPEQILFEKKHINIFYLGPAWDDWSNEDNATYASLNGLTLRPGDENDTGDISNASMLDEEFTNINMMIKYFKFGFGRTTDIVNEQIRNHELTREQAIKIVKQYDGVCSDRIIKRFADYVGISVSQFWDITNTYVNSDIFHIKKGARPIPKFQVGIDYVS
ncbi:N-acetyl sugar amidotransferase [Glaciecola sp. XM2]|jgi:N-acetyl sugar amidotransferase|uniref:N-acetyl sugar amidotransferase n=1 Tax=Glaciecola sp. XM2 TaxID=1914931 RepID=UPI001BDF36C8|nr:N-acetyl sugar amidotransferase [Glaciecola sp. XM2]MBT1452270.1 N-acetyl sugar amidotransferase [Glaciecola sp. XM2]